MNAAPCGGGGRPRRKQCAKCPVIEACRRHALQVAEPYGTWGGLSAEERAEQLRAQRRAASIPGARHRTEREDLNTGGAAPVQ